MPKPPNGLAASNLPPRLVSSDRLAKQLEWNYVDEPIALFYSDSIHARLFQEVRMFTCQLRSAPRRRGACRSAFISLLLLSSLDSLQAQTPPAKPAAPALRSFGPKELPTASPYAKRTPLEQWASNYLLNIILVYDYWLTQPSTATPADKKGQAAREEEGLAARALLAKAAMASFQQSLPVLPGLASKLAAAEQSLQSAGHPLIRPAALTAPQLEATALLFAASFSDSASQSSWLALATSYGLAPLDLSCTPAPSPPNDKPPSLSRLLGPTACAFRDSLAAAKVGTPFPAEPAFLAALPDPSRSLLRSSWLIMATDYSSALQQLWNLLAEYPAYRLTYTQVQRLYSMQEKGSGRVALQNL